MTSRKSLSHKKISLHDVLPVPLGEVAEEEEVQDIVQFVSALELLDKILDCLRSVHEIQVEVLLRQRLLEEDFFAMGDAPHEEIVCKDLNEFVRLHEGQRLKSELQGTG